jgi:hypothetical protein
MVNYTSYTHRKISNQKGQRMQYNITSELLIKWLASKETDVVTDRFMQCKTG